MKWPLVFRRIEGESMAPRLLHGRYVLMTRWYAPLREGDVVMILHGGKEKIKRITQIQSGHVYITGDNRIKSTDSRDFGWLERKAVRAKLLWPRA